jgi:hypothetical protein
MEESGFSKMLGVSYQTTSYHDPGDYTMEVSNPISLRNMCVQSGQVLVILDTELSHCGLVPSC